MDQPGTEKEAVLTEVKKRFGERCVDFAKEQDTDLFYENIAVCSEELLERYFEGEMPKENDIRTLIVRRQIFPCFFGSALKMTDVYKRQL